MQKGGFVFIYLFTYLLICLFAVPPTFARDPYPNKPRVEYIVPPQSAQQPYDGTVSDPQTMMRTNGQRSDIISFSCFNPRESVFAKKYIYLTDPAIDTEKKANSACASHNPPYTEVRPPYLKNNKTTPECQGKTYDAACYDWPIGNFLGPHPKAGKDDGGFVTPLSYGSDGGPLNACGPNRNERCDCPYVPYGPPETNTWMIPIERTVNNQTQRCIAPPYSTSGPWWDWFIGEMNKIQNSFNI